MKPFNLNEYLANPSREIITEDGHPVRIVCTDAKSKYPIVALVEIEDELEKVFKYRKDGSYLDGISKHKHDLYFKPVIKKGWVNIFKPVNQSPSILTDTIYNSKEDALNFIKVNKCVHTDCIKTVCIEWEEE